MILQEIIDLIESWAPSGVALEKDNPGLQVGDLGHSVGKILLSLDVTDEIIEEAVREGADLILSHHPLIYNPLRRIDAGQGVGRQIARLLQCGMAVYSAHTNLDAAPDGVSITLAKRLGIENPRFLSATHDRHLKKLVVFVPAEHASEVRAALAAAGAGQIGAYSHCSFNLSGVGTFLGGEGSSPTMGQKGSLESVAEMRVEMILPDWKLGPVISAMKQAHPYEEVAYDVYPLENADVNFGFGAIGEFAQPLAWDLLIDHLRFNLGADAIGTVQGPKSSIQRLAVCGGSGGELVNEAFRQGADAFLTGEMKYHALQEYRGKLWIFVAGHYHTERVILPVWRQRLLSQLSGASVQVLESAVNTNPMWYQP